jgi:predicted transcriptional regulator
MAYSDQIVYAALLEMISLEGDSAYITQSEIADYSGVSFTTCKRALKRLVMQNLISREYTAGREGGYTYRINNGSYPPAARRAAAPRTA